MLLLHALQTTVYLLYYSHVLTGVHELVVVDYALEHASSLLFHHDPFFYPWETFFALPWPIRI